MNKKIHAFSIFSMIFSIMISPLLVISFNSMTNIAGVDSYISVFIGILMGLIPVYIINKIMSFDENKNIHQINDILFGKIGGKIINIILILNMVAIAINSIYSLTSFISSEFLYKTPQLFIAIMFFIPVLYATIKPIHIFSRSITFFTYFSLLLFILSFLGLITQIKINNIFPIMEFGITKPITSSLIFISYSVLPIFLITTIPKKDIYSKMSLKKIIYISYIIGGISIFLVTFLVISIFGIDLTILYEYPVFYILKRVISASMFERVETILAIQSILYLYITICICIFYIKDGVNHIFNLNKTNTLTFVIILILTIIGNNLYKNTTAYLNFSINYVPVYLSLVATFFVPILIYYKIKKHR